MVAVAMATKVQTNVIFTPNSGRAQLHMAYDIPARFHKV
jgi:hypothetical protein